MKDRLYRRNERGLSILAVVFVMAIVGVVFLFVGKIIPIQSENKAINIALKQAVSSTTFGANFKDEVRRKFDDASRAQNYDFDSRDLEFTDDGKVSYQYTKKVPIAGSMYLGFDFSGKEQVF